MVTKLYDTTNFNVMMENRYRARENVNTDAIGYAGANSGCTIATEHMGKPSRCLDCPFEVCKLKGEA